MEQLTRLPVLWDNWIPPIGATIDPQAVDILDGLELWLLTNDNAGTVVRDISSKQRNATFAAITSGAAAWQGGLYGPGVFFSNAAGATTGPYLDGGGAAQQISLPAADTFSFWVRHDIRPASSTQVIIGSWNGTAAQWSVELTTTGQVNYNYASSSTTATFISVATIPIGIWSHVVVIDDGRIDVAGSVRIWINGQESTVTSTVPGGVVKGAAAPWFVAKDGTGANDEFLCGAVQNLMVWSTAKPEGLVQALYSEPYQWLLPPEPQWEPWFVPAGTTTQTLFPSAVNGTWAVVDPAFSFDQTLTPAAVNGTWAVQAPTFTSPVTLSPSAVNGTWAVQAPAFSTPVTLSPAAVNGTWAVAAPTFTSPVTLSPSAVNGTWGVQAPTLTAHANLTPAAVNGTWSVQDPGFSGGAAPNVGDGGGWWRRRRR